MDPEPNRTKMASVTDNENLADQMDAENVSEGDQRHLINWNQSATKTCRRRHRAVRTV